MIVTIWDHTYELDERDLEIVDLAERRRMAPVDVRIEVADRMQLPEYRWLKSVNGNVCDCRRRNIESVRDPEIDRVRGTAPACVRPDGLILPKYNVMVRLDFFDIMYVKEWSWRPRAHKSVFDLVQGYYKKTSYVECIARRHRLKGDKRHVTLHKVVAERMGLDTSRRVYFKDGDYLNCRRCNLTNQQSECKEYVTPSCALMKARLELAQV